MLNHLRLADIALRMTLGIGVGTPDNEAKTFNVVAIFTTMKSNQLVSWRDLKVFPTLSLIVRVGVATAIPEVVHEHVSTLIHKTQSLYVPATVILIDVDVREPA